MSEIRDDIFIKLDNPRAWRTYTGGKRLDELHGQKNSIVSQFPEEWIMSMTVARNTGREEFKDEGMSHLVDYDNLSFKDFILSNPEKYLGKAFFNKYGPTTGVLVKLIDSAERLTVQVHPDKKDAKRLFNSNYGKTECWYILDDKPIDGIAPSIYIGFKKGITKEKWKELFEKQDIKGMLEWMHHINVKKGETILIKGGLPHAIGQYCFLVEIQEPTDYTIRIERTTPKGLKISDFMCHQGLGFDKMFDCFHYIGMSEEEVKENYFIKPISIFDDNNGNKITTLVGYSNTELFELDRLDIQTHLHVKKETCFSGIYILEGQGILKSKNSTINVKKGEQYFIPCNLGDFDVESTKTLVILHFKGPKI